MPGGTEARPLAFDSYVVIDVETTGLDNAQCEIIEMAAIRVVDGRIDERFDELVRPSSLSIPPSITQLTGIKKGWLKRARMFPEVYASFSAVAGDLPVVGHNVSFDVGFIDAATTAHGLGRYEPVTCDTLELSRMLFPKRKRHRLKDTFSACAAAKGEDIVFDDGHRAGIDALATWYCYEAMKPMLAARMDEGVG